MSFMDKYVNIVNTSIKHPKPVTANFADAYSAPAGGNVAVDPLAALKNNPNITLQDLVKSMPSYQSARNPDGSLKGVYSVNPATSDAYNKLKATATTEGPTDYYKANMGLINTNAHNALNSLDAGNAGAYATGVSDLAQGGGVDAGALERLGRQRMMAHAGGAADVYAGAGTSAANALIADTNLKNQLLSGVASTDIGAQQYNSGVGVGDLGNSNSYNLQGWGKVGDIYGSGQIADAMAKQANQPDKGLLGQGGVLGTGVGPGGSVYDTNNPSNPLLKKAGVIDPTANGLFDVATGGVTNPLGVAGSSYNAGKSLLRF